MADGRQQFVNMAHEPKGHMGEPKTRINTNIDSSIFDLFSGLSSASDDSQAECVVKLIKHFSDSSHRVKGDNGNLSQELLYVLKRLVRGLGAPRPQVLKGYFTALSCLLSSLPEITYEDVKGCISKELSNTGSASNDKKDLLVAKTLVWGAVMRSGLFQRASTDQQQEIFADVLACSRKKSYLPLAAYAFLVDIIPTLEPDVFRSVVWPLLKDELIKPWEHQTLDSLILLLVCRKHHRNTVKSKFLKEHLGTSELMADSTMSHFAQRLLFSTHLKHPIYAIFCNYLSTPDNVPLLEKFWCKDINKLLSTVKNKDLATLELFTNLVQCIGPNDHLAVLFTDQIIAFLNNASSDFYKTQFPEVQDQAQKAVVAVGNLLTQPEVSDSARLAVLKALLFRSSNLQYEKVQNLEKSTHILTAIIGMLESKNAMELTLMFKNVLISASQNHVNRKDLMFAVQQFSRLVHHPNIEDMDWRVDQLKFLVELSIFKGKHAALAGDACATLKQSFFKALGTKLPSLENLLQVLNKLADHVEELLSSGHALRVPLSSESSDAWKKMMTAVKKMKNSKPGSVEQIFQLLFLYMGLYLFMDAQMAEDALKELHSCYEHSSSKKNTKRKSLKATDDPNWIEVTVELLLSLLSHGSNLLRTVVGIVFTHLRKHITPEALNQILEVLHPSESEATVSVVDDMNGEERDAAESDDDTSEVNGENGSINEDSSDDSTLEVDEDSDFEDESLDEEETVNDQLRSEIRTVLGNCASDNESVDIDDADEDELRRVDEALAKAFESVQQKRQMQRGKKNKKQSKVDELLMHFRLRVLDLVEIFLAKTPAFSLILPTIQPLFALLEFSSRDAHMKILATRVRSLLSKIASIKKFSSLDNVKQSEIAEVLATLINKGNRTTAVFLETVDVVTNCCSMLVRCSEHLPVTKKDSGNELIDICKGALQSFLTKRDCLLPIGLFRSILTLEWKGCWPLGELLVEGAFDSELRPIRRTHSAELLGVLFSNQRLMKFDSASKNNTLGIITSTLISNAANLLSNSRTNDHLQQKYLAGLCRSLHLCLLQRKASPESVAELTTALSKFCAANPPHGEAKKPLNKLTNFLGCKNKLVGNKKNKGKAKKTQNEPEGSDSRVNGFNGEHSNAAGRSNTSINVDSIATHTNEKRKDISNSNHNEAGSSKKKKRKSNQSANAVGSGKKHPEEDSFEGTCEELIPKKKIKTPTANGSSNGGKVSVVTTTTVDSNVSPKKKKKKKSLSIA